MSHTLIYNLIYALIRFQKITLMYSKHINDIFSPQAYVPQNITTATQQPHAPLLPTALPVPVTRTSKETAPTVLVSFSQSQSCCSFIFGVRINAH